MLDDMGIRMDAIQHVHALRQRWVAVPASELRSFESAGVRVFLKSTQGIFKPAQLRDPLSITSTLASSYTDDPIDGTRVLYDFAPASREYENDGLKRCADEEIPILYFLQVKGKPNPEYLVFAPTYVIGWDDTARRFLVDLSEQKPGDVLSPAPGVHQLSLPSARTHGPQVIRDVTKGYAITTVQRRLHQARFRNQILSVYRDRCAVCVLQIRPLLDAAHVVADRDPKPVIEINEGLALCATHHRAFDARILRYDASYNIRVELPANISVGDGERSMLLAFHGRALTLPSDRRWWPATPDQTAI